jgi:hypothetical protein
MHLYAVNRRSVSTVAAVLMVVVVIAAFSILVATALLFRPFAPTTGSGAPVTGSGRLLTKELQYKDFRIVRVVSAFQVGITYSNSYKVSVTMDDNIFDYLQATKEGDVLTIGLKLEQGTLSLSLKAEIQLPELYELQLDGAARGKIQGFNSSHEFTLLLSGASSAEIADTSVGDVEIEISAAGRLSGSMTANGEARFTLSAASTATLGGKANNLLIDASAASHLELSDFTVHNARVNISGASQAKINLDGRLDAYLSGASTLLYRGEPTLGDISVTGGSTISKE